MKRASRDADRAASAGKAPATGEVEITPEMIAAGCGEISGFDLEDARDGFLDRGELVARIYLAMLRALVERKLEDEIVCTCDPLDQNCPLHGAVAVEKLWRAAGLS